MVSQKVVIPSMLKSKSFLLENDFLMVFKVFKINLFMDGCLYDLLRRLNYLR